mgnify:CR=1 FL=1
MEDMSEFDNNKEELFKKYETINNQEKFAKINKNIALNNDNMIQMGDEDYLTQKNKKGKNNFVNLNKDNESLDSNDNINDNINTLINKNSSKLYRQKMFNDNNDYNSSINKYQSEINKLKKEIESLENSNDILSNQLKEEEKRNEELNIIKNEKEENDNSILLDISHCLQVNSFDEILPKLTEMINYLNKYNNDENSKIKEDLISKLKSLYIATNDIKESKDNISIQDLWRWIKQLINNVKQLSVEKEKNEEIYKQNNYEIYKNYCEKLIKEFGLNSFDELKFFINDLLTKNNLNKKRVEKLKKVLMNNNEKEESTSSAYNNNDENDYENLMMNNNERINGNNKKYNLNLDEMNIGGGLGVKYTEKDCPPEVNDLARVVGNAIKKFSSNIPTIYLEPGRSIISTSGVTLYRIGSSKCINLNGSIKKYVAVDGGMADNPRPSMYQAEYTAEVVDKNKKVESEKVTIAGRYCESGDILINEIELPKLEAGDIICVYNTGAYNYSMASNYNRVEKPAMVLVNNSQSDIIVNRESLDDLISHDNIPNRLNK